MIDVITDLTEDAFLGGQLLLKQKRSGHRAGHDAILLAAATEVREGDRVVDLGAGVGTAGLAWSRSTRNWPGLRAPMQPQMRLPLMCSCSTSRPMRRPSLRMGSCLIVPIAC
jgi:hypothetical protein